MVPRPAVRNLLLMVGAVALTVLSACGAGSSVAKDAVGNAAQSGSAPAAGADASENAKLEALASARRGDQSEDDFTLGPGDVLQCSVPAIEDLKDRSVRVSGDDTIALPLIGVIDVKGMTEQDVRNALKKRLEKYMYDPQVEVFAKEYQSRQVAVVGMVQKPRLYPLTSPTDTVLSTISRAGGMTEAAAPRLLLIPAPPGQGARTSALLAAAAGIGENGNVDHVADGGNVASTATQSQQVGQDVATHDANAQSVPASYTPQATTVPPTLAHTEPIVIDLSNTASESHLDLPARPGDVVIVPAAGEVMVKGWVKNEGAFKITPNMTVLGAVTAAGGQMFSSSAEILRTDLNGGKVEIPVDLSAIEKMSAPDVPVQAGDIVIVNRSATGAVPYALYSLFSKFGTGVSMMAY